MQIHAYGKTHKQKTNVKEQHRHKWGGEEGLKNQNTHTKESVLSSVYVVYNFPVSHTESVLQATSPTMLLVPCCAYPQSYIVTSLEVSFCQRKEHRN